MKRLKVYMAIAACLVSGLSSAQSIEDIYKLSFKSREFGSARSVAMGGAFTSLGADISSISINPAGLGMYRSSEIVFTPAVVWNSANSDVYDMLDNNKLYSSFKERNTKLISNNLGAVINTYNNSYTAIKSVNIGFSIENSMNRKVHSYVESPSTVTSIGDFFAGQLYGINYQSIDNSGDVDQLAVYRDRLNVGLWGAGMAYNTILVSDIIGKPTEYAVDGMALSAGDLVNPGQEYIEHINNDVVNFSAGANILDRIYVGATLGIYNYSLSRYVNYQEFGVQGNVGELENLTYEENTYISGSSVDLKFGATVEPMDGLRFGVAYQTPTIATSSGIDEYFADMSTSFTDGDYFVQQTPYSLLEYGVRRPGSLLAGASITIPYGILSFDYERTWYNKMKINGVGFANEVNNEIENYFRPTNSFMVGAEIRPIDNLYVRGGYAYYGSPYASSLGFEDYMQQTSVSFGLGYRYNNFGLDIAYVLSSYSVPPTTYYDGLFIDPNNPNNDISIVSPSIVEEKINSNILSFTLLYRF